MQSARLPTPGQLPDPSEALTITQSPIARNEIAGQQSIVNPYDHGSQAPASDLQEESASKLKEEVTYLALAPKNSTAASSCAVLNSNANNERKKEWNLVVRI